MSMRQGEEVYSHIRDTLIACKNHLRDDISESASSEFAANSCREFIRDTLDPDEQHETVELLGNDLLAPSALSVGVGAMFMTAIL
jgi:hypothetical protein